jgi:RimJ/RimL family protein N-acetyltransferase
VSGTKEDVVHASIIDMTLRLPVDDALFDELRTDFLPRAAQHPGFRGFQYVLAEQGRAIGILGYEQPDYLDGITQLVGTWFQDHMAPRLVGPETVVRGRVVVNTTPPHTT